METVDLSVVMLLTGFPNFDKKLTTGMNTALPKFCKELRNDAVSMTAAVSIQNRSQNRLLRPKLTKKNYFPITETSFPDIT